MMFALVSINIFCKLGENYLLLLQKQNKNKPTARRIMNRDTATATPIYISGVNETTPFETLK